MTLDDVKAAVEEISNRRDEDEVAHHHEDALYCDVLAYFATFNDERGALAREALKTKEIHFSRWYE